MCCGQPARNEGPSRSAYSWKWDPDCHWGISTQEVLSIFWCRVYRCWGKGHSCFCYQGTVWNLQESYLALGNIWFLWLYLADFFQSWYPCPWYTCSEDTLPLLALALEEKKRKEKWTIKRRRCPTFLDWLLESRCHYYWNWTKHLYSLAYQVGSKHHLIVLTRSYYSITIEE